MGLLEESPAPRLSLSLSLSLSSPSVRSMMSPTRKRMRASGWLPMVMGKETKACGLRERSASVFHIDRLEKCYTYYMYSSWYSPVSTYCVLNLSVHALFIYM